MSSSSFSGVAQPPGVGPLVPQPNANAGGVQAGTLASPGVNTSANSPLPVAYKSREEILTSLHLIKDIRRLETYQRDFFLKVRKEAK